MSFYSTKNYPPSLGLSACFRQWRAESHCRYIHGYSLGFRFKFAAGYLDDNGWVVDFGGLKRLKETLVELFDHRLIVAEDDPYRMHLELLDEKGVADILILPRVGVEAFARMMYEEAAKIVNNNRVRVVSCECYEHEANSAIYEIA